MTSDDLTGPVMTSTARRVAALAHAGQVDATGAPYQGHVNRVAARAELLRGRLGLPLDRFDVEAAAVLHDVLEDSSVTAEDLRAAGIPERVVQAVDVLTHRAHEPRVEYLNRVAGHPLARVVKLADTLDNADPVRLRAVPEGARRERLQRKYAAAFETLQYS